MDELLRVQCLFPRSAKVCHVYVMTTQKATDDFTQTAKNVWGVTLPLGYYDATSGLERPVTIVMTGGSLGDECAFVQLPRKAFDRIDTASLIRAVNQYDEATFICEYVSP